MRLLWGAVGAVLLLLAALRLVKPVYKQPDASEDELLGCECAPGPQLA